MRFTTGTLAAYFSSVCSVVEYITSVFLEWKWGMRWWDYSEFALNINGRICLLGAVCFGLGGMLLNCYLMPVYMRVYHKISRKWRLILCGILLLAFILDATYCAVSPNRGHGIAWDHEISMTKPGAPLQRFPSSLSLSHTIMRSG